MRAIRDGAKFGTISITNEERFGGDPDKAQAISSSRQGKLPVEIPQNSAGS